MSEIESLMLVGTVIVEFMAWVATHLVTKINTVESRMLERMLNLERRFDKAAVELRVRIAIIERTLTLPCPDVDDQSSSDSVP